MSLHDPGRPGRDPRSGRFARLSDDITISLRNGQRVWKGTLKDIPNLLNQIVQEIIEIEVESMVRGAEKGLEQFGNFVALKTGVMRSVFVSSIKQQILLPERRQVTPHIGKVSIRINLTPFLNKVSYGIYHIFDFTGVSDYADATTPGTKPIDLREMRQILIFFEIAEFNRLITSKGYIVSHKDLISVSQLTRGSIA